MFGIAGIWALLGLPLLTSVILLLFFASKTKWWELLLVWGVSIIVIFFAQVTAEYVAISDKEWWGFNSVKAQYDEPFEYWTTCSESYACGLDSKGNTTYCTRYYPCTKWGGDMASLIDQTGQSIRISKAKFNQLCERWGNKEFVELHREKEYDIETDGDRFVTTWPKGDWKKSEPIVSQHTYKNKTQCSSTMYFREVTKELKDKYGLIDYPSGGVDGYEMVSIIDNYGRAWPLPNKRFQYLNGILGPYKLVRVWVFIFNNQPRDSAFLQRDYLKNGNKNEVIICIGTDKAMNITWGEVISWTDRSVVKAELRDFVENMGTLTDETFIGLADYTEQVIKTKYIKPDFTKKFEHLSVKPPLTTIVPVTLFVLLANVGVAMYVVSNEFNDKQRGSSSKTVKPPGRRTRSYREEEIERLLKDRKRHSK